MNANNAKIWQAVARRMCEQIRNRHHEKRNEKRVPNDDCVRVTCRLEVKQELFNIKRVVNN